MASVGMACVVDGIVICGVVLEETKIVEEKRRTDQTLAPATAPWMCKNLAIRMYDTAGIVVNGPKKSKIVTIVLFSSSNFSSNGSKGMTLMTRWNKLG